jgi:hypothetical protein
MAKCAPQAGHANRQYSDSSHPLRRPNAELRTREHLSEAEVERLIEATSSHELSRSSTCPLLKDAAL